jgi:hypothetical protein
LKVLRKGTVTLHEIADLLLSPMAECLSHGNYLNRRGIRGYYVQIKCGNHWCKVSVSHADRHSARITIGELNALDPSTLFPALVIPISSISTALKSSDAEQVPTNCYRNSTGIEGIWTEFHHRGNWYMVSLSAAASIPAPFSVWLQSTTQDRFGLSR